MKLQRSQDVDVSKVGDRHVLYHKSLRKAVVLNPTGSLIWTFLESQSTDAELIESMSRTFPDVPVEQLRKDLTPYLKELVDQGVIAECN